MLSWLLPILAITGCWKPTTTGPRSMVGTLVDAQGEPVSGVTIDTVEARWVTDEQGHFVVNYKEPSQFLTFTVQGIAYQRTYRPADDGKEVVLQLPELTPRVLSCDADATCDATMTWDLGDGFQAKVQARCDRDELQTIAASPVSLPNTTTCRVDATSPAEELHVRPIPKGLQITLPPVDVWVAMRTQSKRPPRKCEVYVNGVPVFVGEDGRYHTKDFGYLAVTGSCEGIPAVPQRVYTRTPAELELTWDRETPVVDLQPFTPWIDALTVAQVRGTGAGWSIDIPAQPDGRFPLPALGPGVYMVGAGMSLERIQGSRPMEALESGELHFREMAPSDWLGPDPEALGVLFVDKVLADGDVPVIFYQGEL